MRACVGLCTRVQADETEFIERSMRLNSTEFIERSTGSGATCTSTDCRILRTHGYDVNGFSPPSRCHLQLHGAVKRACPPFPPSPPPSIRPYPPLPPPHAPPHDCGSGRWISSSDGRPWRQSLISLASRLAFNASHHAGPLLAHEWDAATAPPHPTPCIRLDSTEFN